MPQGQPQFQGPWETAAGASNLETRAFWRRCQRRLLASLLTGNKQSVRTGAGRETLISHQDFFMSVAALMAGFAPATTAIAERFNISS